MNKIIILIATSLLIFLCSCGNDADKVSRAINTYCDVVEDAIGDDVVDDGDVLDIKDAEAEYISIISAANENLAGKPDELAKFQQELYSKEAWKRLSEVNNKLANTEGYIKLSLTDK